MCVALWSLEHPDYALILCSNRDEYLSRPTENAQFHSFRHAGNDKADEESVLSGRDLLAGGTWAGVSRSGRVALLTNITEPPRKYACSRGDLASAFLLPGTPSLDFRNEVGNIVSRNTKYAGFNLLLLSPRLGGGLDKPKLSFDAVFLTNSGGGGDITARELSEEERRCGGMSNGIDQQGAADWPKIKRGLELMQAVLDGLPEGVNEAELVESLFRLLSWTSHPAPVDRSTLRNTIQVEPLLVPTIQSPTVSRSDCYGTRLSTVILIRRDGTVLFVERDIWTLNANGDVVKANGNNDRVFNFRIEIDHIVRE